jgi:two-component system sensor histidine kinase HupT/HoxJ
MSSTPLTGQVTLPPTQPNALDGNGEGEGAWIEVIQRMDEIYADLVHSQVELEQKNADLEDAHSFIDSVISSISDVLVVCDVDGRIQRVNRALEALTGRNAAELIDQPLATLFGADYQQQVAGFAEHIRADALIDCEVDMLDRDGQPTPMAVNCSARYDHERRLSGLVMTGRPLDAKR